MSKNILVHQKLLLKSKNIVVKLEEIHYICQKIENTHKTTHNTHRISCTKSFVYNIEGK